MKSWLLCFLASLLAFSFMFATVTAAELQTTICYEEDKYAVGLSSSGVFKEEPDGKWKCCANTTIYNLSEENITVMWIHFKAINITFIDESFEELNIPPKNDTYDEILRPMKNFVMHWNITGFNKKPKIICVRVTMCLSEVEEPFISIEFIAEFPSALILPLFIVVSLIVVTTSKRKRVLCLGRTPDALAPNLKDVTRYIRARC